MADIYVSNASELLSALSKASGGDTILLNSGDYGAVNLSGLKFNDYVTIRSADGNMGAEFDALNIMNSSFIRVDNVKVASPSNTGTSVAYIDNSDYIEFINSEVHGKVDNVYPIEGPKHGIFVTGGSTNITVSDNYVHNVVNGITNFGTSDLNLVGNTVDYVGSDGFKFSGVNGALVENNVGPSYFYPLPDAHEDFMQFQGSPSHNITIVGNVFLPQNAFDVQGIFLSGQGGHSNITIEQNIIYTVMANGIVVETDAGETVTISHNTLVNALSDSRPATLIDAPAGATVEYNIISHKVGELNGTNITMQHLDPNGEYYYSDLFTGLLEGPGITLENLRPVEGSLAETYGANERLMELLDGTAGSNTGNQLTPEPEPVPEPTPEPDNGSGGSGDDDASLNTDPNVSFALMGAHEITGSSDVIEVAHSDALALSSATIAFSFNADSVAGTKGLVSKDARGDGDHFTSYIKNGTLYFRAQDGTTSETIKVTGIKANTDYDVQIALGEGGMSVWIDGNLVGSVSTGIDWTNNAEYLQIGANGWSSGSGASGFKHVFDGTISDVMIVEGLKTPAALGSIQSGDATGSGDGVLSAASPEIFRMDGDTEFSGLIRDVANVAHNAGFETADGTIAFSFNADTVSGRLGLISKDASGYTGGGNHFSAWIENGSLHVRFQDGAADAVFTVDNIQANRTYEVTAFFDENGVGVYLDGNLVGTSALTMDWTDNTEYLQVGGLGWASDTGANDVQYAFDGTISDVTIWDEVYTPQEIDLFV